MVQNHGAQGSVRRVALWLEGHPDDFDLYHGIHEDTAAIEAYEANEPNPRPLSKYRRRHLARVPHNLYNNKQEVAPHEDIAAIDDYESSPLPKTQGSRKRKTLAEVSHNIYNCKQEVEMSKNTGDGFGQPPRKRSRVVDRTVPVAPLSLPDLDQTPRANSSSLIFARLDETTWTGSPTRSAASRSSASTRRSVSPTKRLGDLRLAEMPVRSLDPDNKEHPLPDEARDLTLKIKDIATGVALMPTHVKGLAQKRGLFTEHEVHNFNFSDSAPGSDDASGAEYVFRDAYHIYKAAAMCVEDGLPEAAWNAEVHSRILNLALRGWREDENVWYLDVTTARISSSILSTNHPIKMVDYALVLHPNDTLDRRIRTKLLSLTSPTTRQLLPISELSINHSKAEHLRFKPIAVSIETKRALTGDEERGQVQLGVWAGAHYRKLMQLMDEPADVDEDEDDGEEGLGQQGPPGSSVNTAGMQARIQHKLPILPLVLVQGHDWKLMIASLVNGDYAEGEGGEQPDEVFIHGDWVMGDTRGVLGVYKLVESVRALGRWTRDVYQPWFIENAC